MASVQKEHANCLNDEASGRVCNAAGRDAAIAVAITGARAGLDLACTLANYNEIGFKVGTAEEIRDGLIGDAIGAAVKLIRDTYVAEYENKP